MNKNFWIEMSKKWSIYFDKDTQDKVAALAKERAKKDKMVKSNYNNNLLDDEDDDEE